MTKIDGRSAWCRNMAGWPHEPCSYAGCTCRDCGHAPRLEEPAPIVPIVPVVPAARERVA